MPALQPVELWKESGRYEAYGDLLMKLTISGSHQMALGPTHEEVITDMVRDLVRSYKQLPITLYQIQTKFRDEPRPRFGIVRTREFLMKDAYSIDADLAQLNASYDAMYEAYCRIFDRCGLPYVIVEAESGPIGGDSSHEFMVPCSTGEDKVIYCAAVRLRGQPGACRGRRSRPRDAPPAADAPPYQAVPTPNKRTIREVCEFLGVEESTSAKLLVYLADGKPVAALVRGDHELNEAKLRRAVGASTRRPGRRGHDREGHRAPRWASSGRSAIKIPLVIDRAIAAMPTVVVGGNAVDVHFKGVVPGRDFPLERVHDIRNADAGDPCPRCGSRAGDQGGPRDRPRLQARHQVFQGDGGDLPRREGERGPHRSWAATGSASTGSSPAAVEAGARRERHHLAAAARALSRAGRPAPGPEPGRDGAGRWRWRRRWRRPGSTSWSTTAISGRA